jgi:hypothetical protein
VVTGPNARALAETLAARDVDADDAGELAALVTLAQTLAGRLDVAVEPTAAMATAYLRAVTEILARTVREGEDDGTSEALARLRAV